MFVVIILHHITMQSIQVQLAQPAQPRQPASQCIHVQQSRHGADAQPVALRQRRQRRHGHAHNSGATAAPLRCPDQCVDRPGANCKLTPEGAAVRVLPVEAQRFVVSCGVDDASHGLRQRGEQPVADGAVQVGRHDDQPASELVAQAFAAGRQQSVGSVVVVAGSGGDCFAVLADDRFANVVQNVHGVGGDAELLERGGLALVRRHRRRGVRVVLLVAAILWLMH